MSEDPVLMHQQCAITNLINRAHPRYLDCSKLSIGEAEKLGTLLATLIRDVPFWFGDLARYSEARWPDIHHQVWPTFVSPGQLSRNAGVCKSYPRQQDREHEATFTQYRLAGRHVDRQEIVAGMVCQTTDESRQAQKADSPPDDRPRWLLCVDVNFFLHKFYYRAGGAVSAASDVVSWVERLVDRLKEGKGLTDVVCCYDSRENHRKALTADWDQKNQYKGDRTPKPPELSQQLNLVFDLMNKAGFACAKIAGYEADDCIASFAKTFPGKVAILSKDKDFKQCLSGERVVMLTDVTWAEDAAGDMHPTYHWYTEKKHSRIECDNLLDETGLRPDQFTDLQCLWGDAADCIKGAPGIGEVSSLLLMHEFGSLAACIQAAHDEDPRLLDMNRGKIMAKGLFELEQKVGIIRQLVTLVDNLEVNSETRL